MPTSTGLFITFEGPEGAGKSTQVARLQAWLHDRGRACLVTREPGGTELGEALRTILLRQDSTPMARDAELLLMFAARAEHLAKVIEPAISRGSIVLCDRFTDATYAYQGGGRGIDHTRISALETWVQGSRRPNLTILIDLPVDQGMQRVSARGAPIDRFEALGQTFLQRVRETYLSRASAYPERYLVVDGAQSADDVQALIVDGLSQRHQDV